MLRVTARDPSELRYTNVNIPIGGMITQLRFCVKCQNEEQKCQIPGPSRGFCSVFAKESGRLAGGLVAAPI